MQKLTKAAVVAYIKNRVVASKLSGDTRNAIENGKAQLKKSIAYVRKEITIGGGTIPLIDSNTKELQGISSFAGNSLPKFVNQFFDRVSLGYVAAGAGSSPANLSYDRSFPAGLRNANLVIKQDGDVVVSIPCTELDSNGVAIDSLSGRFEHLGGVHMIREEKQFSIELMFPENATGTTTEGEKDFVEVMIDGIKTTERN